MPFYSLFLKLRNFMLSYMNEVNSYVTSDVSFVWDAKLVFLTIGIRANFNIMLLQYVIEF